MPSQVIIIARKKYAAGLFWQPVAAGMSARNYSRQLARTVDRKLNLFTEYRAMVGLGARRQGHRLGMPSAAAEVMEALAEFSSFLAVFKVGALYWMVAVRNGIIIRDKLFDSEEIAKGEYVTLSGMPDWGALFAPSVWGMPRAVSKQPEEVLTGNVRASLRPISRFKTDFMSVVLLLAFVFSVVYFFQEPISQMMETKKQIAEINPELAAEYKKRMEEKNKELDERYNIKKVEPVKPLEMPYELLPNPHARAQLCYQAIGFLMQQVPGWVQTDAACGDTHATVTFKRSFGTLADFFVVVPDLMPGAFVQEKSDSEIFVSAKLPLLPAAASLEEKDPDTIVRDVNTLFQKIKTPVEINVVTDTVSNDISHVDLNVIEIGVESKLTPPEFIKIFDNLQGVYMTRCTWDVRVRTWNYEVIIYAK